MGTLDDAGNDLADRSSRSASIRHNEAELRADLWVFFQPWAMDSLGLADTDLAQEGPGKAGRFDSRIGRCIIEYKRPGLLDSRAEREKAAEQSIDYLGDATLGVDVVILTDGSTWALLRDRAAGPELGEQGWLDFGEGLELEAIDRFTWRPNSPETCTRVLTLVSTVRSSPVTAPSLIAHLGPSRAEVAHLLAELALQLTNRAPNGRVDTLFRQWLQLAGVAYGLETGEEPWPHPPARLVGDAMATALGSTSYAEGLFALHTYVALASKLIAAEVLALVSNDQDNRPTQWAGLGRKHLDAAIGRLESGEVTSALRAPDLLSGDLFGWYSSVLPTSHDLSDAIRRVIYSMAELAWARVANSISGIAGDLLREFYAAVVPKALRRQLGEFFTPQWLAERTLFRAVELSGLRDKPLRVLDPACGSGTFLVAALARSLLIRTQLLGESEGLAASNALDEVIGFDINPVSVIMARVNLLLALGQSVEQLAEIHVGVYQADSILLPETALGEVALDNQGEMKRLPLQVGDMEVHAAVATLDGLGALRANIERAVRENRSEDAFTRRLASDLKNVGVGEADLAEALVAANRMYVRIKELDVEGRDGVWARIVEQAFAPAMTLPFDVVIGNPPWINWKHLPQAWQDRSEGTWKRWGLWATKARGGGVPLADISTLLLARSLATYARPGGVVGFLLPESFLISDPGNERMRRCNLLPEHEDLDADDSVLSAFRPIAVDDWTAIKPFSPDAANLPIALFLRSATPYAFPIEKVVWRRAQSRSQIPRYWSWTDTQTVLVSNSHQIAPVEDGNPSSPWVPIGPFPLLPKGSGKSHYRWGQGFHTRGADGLLTVEVTTREPDHRGLVRVRSRPDLGTNTLGEPGRDGLIESQMLWPLVRGQNVHRFEVQTEGLYVIVAHHSDDLTRVMTVEELIDEAPHTYDFLEPVAQRLAHRSPYQELQPDDHRPWGIQGPWSHMRRDGVLVLARYIHSQKRPPAAVVTSSFDAKLGLVTTAYPNNKSNFIAVSTEDEAIYVASWINSESASAAISRIASSTTIGPTTLQRLPIAKYDPQNHEHRKVVEAARADDSEALDELIIALSGQFN